MVNYKKHILNNGLRLIMHKDTSTPMVAVNVLYDVGSRDEDPQHTGLAHLFEHLMFEGSLNIPNYDNALQMAGGENNAFTTNDLTNYYLSLPGPNLETALWLESDRMLELAFSKEKLRIQKDVVTEEFRQTTLNQPYGDVWALLRSLIYKKHPYQWPTIGKNIEQIQQTTIEDVRAFFYRFYRPNNAILSITGDIDYSNVIALVEKWFGGIAPGEPNVRNLPAEPAQTSMRRLWVERDVPFDEIYMAFPTGKRLEQSYYTTDLITDVLASGTSARLRENLVKNTQIFSEANAWITGSRDNGFLVAMGKLHKGQSVEAAEEALWKQLNLLKDNKVGEKELQKVKNKTEASHTFSEVGILSRAVNLAYYELLGDASMLNNQVEKYFSIEKNDLMSEAENVFQPHNASVLHYLAKPLAQ